MSSIARFEAVFSGQVPDRVPVIGNLCEHGARELGMSIEEYYADGQNVAEAQIKMRQRYGYDNVNAFFYAAREAELLGCRRVIHSNEGPPNVGHMILRNAEEIEALEIPEDVASHPKFTESRRCIQLLRREVGGRYPISSAIVASFSLPPLLMGTEKWMELLMLGPQPLCQLLLEKCSDFCIRHALALRAAGVDSLSYSNPMASADILTLGQFKNLALPWIKRDIEGIGEQGLVYFNGGGRINPMLDTLLEETGFKVFFINPLDDVAEASCIVGDRGVSCGAINDIQLIHWMPAQVDREVRLIMRAGAPGGRFLFGTLMMPYAVPESNIRALFESALRRGRYRPGSDDVSG